MKRRSFIKSSASIAAMVSAPSIIKGFNKIGSIERIKPNHLKEGDTIGLIAPGSYVTEDDLEESIEKIEKLGFKVYYTDRILKKEGYLAGNDENRTSDINHMFGNTDVDGIICVRGGYGCNRILPMIDYDNIRKNPKALIGYSDVTALLYAIYAKTRLVTFHGPVGLSTFNDYSVNNFKSVLMKTSSKNVLSSADESERNDNPEYNRYVIKGGKAQGKLIGGNLSIVVTLPSTEFDVDCKGKILFLEEIDEKPYRVDRMLTELLLTNKLQQLSGIALGVFDGCNVKEGTVKEEESFTLKEVLIDRLSELNIPVIYGLSFGHITNKITVPFGIEAELDADNETITLLESAVI